MWWRPHCYVSSSRINVSWGIEPRPGLDTLRLQLAAFPFLRPVTPFGVVSCLLFCLGGFSTYLLYLDESGNENDPADRHFILAGAAVFEQNTFFLARALDEIQTKHCTSLGRPRFLSTFLRFELVATSGARYLVRRRKKSSRR